MLNFIQLGLLLLIYGADAQSSASCPTNFNATVTIASQADATSLAACSEISSSIFISPDFQGSLVLDGPTKIDGSFSCDSAAGIVSIESSSLYWINGGLTLSNLPKLSTINMAQLNSSTGVVNLSNLPSLNQFGVASQLSGESRQNMTISNTNLASVPNFVNYGLISIFSNSQLQNITISASELDSLNIYSNGPALNLSLSNLETTQGDLIIQNCSSINMPAVNQIGGGLVIAGSKLTSFSLGLINTIGGSLIIADNQQMTSISFSNLKATGGTFDISNNHALTSFSAPFLQSALDIYISANSLLQAINFPNIIGFRNAYLSGSFSSLSLPQMRPFMAQGSINITTTNSLQSACSSFNFTSPHTNASATFYCKASNTSSSDGSISVQSNFRKLMSVCVFLVVGKLLFL